MVSLVASVLNANRQVDSVSICLILVTLIRALTELLNLALLRGNLTMVTRSVFLNTKVRAPCNAKIRTQRKPDSQKNKGEGYRPTSRKCIILKQYTRRNSVLPNPG